MTLQVEISKNYSLSDWREDLKNILRTAGAESKQVIFLFSDTHIKHEAFVEDINNILNSGEVPNMYPVDERMQVTFLFFKLIPICVNVFTPWTGWVHL
jgi:dynein heavy chain, axonemal